MHNYYTCASGNESDGKFAPGFKSKKKLKIKSLTGVKEMVIDFVCREDLIITTLREFFEIFISSIKKDQNFHTELLSSKYNYIGI